MIYLLDTNAVIAILKGQAVAVRTRLKRVSPKATAIALSSIIVRALVRSGTSERQRENTERLRIFLSGAISVIPFDADDAATAGEVRAALEATGKRIGPYDLLIAAQALRLRATLVTANVSELERVRGLVWQDWAAKG